MVDLFDVNIRGNAVTDRIDASGDCWEWTGPLTSDGYGKIGINHGGTLAHRVIWEALVGKIPKGLTIDHLCRNRRCVNPDHLECVSQRVNTFRGHGVGMVNARKDACPKGHHYDMVEAGGARRCRQCRNETARQSYYQRRKHEAEQDSGQGRGHQG